MTDMDIEDPQRRQDLVTAILNHGGYHCDDPDCILECVQDTEGRS